MIVIYNRVKFKIKDTVSNNFQRTRLYTSPNFLT